MAIYEEEFGKLAKTSNTTLSLSGRVVVKLGGQFKNIGNPSFSLTNGLDTGVVEASTVYYVYAIPSGLVASKSQVAPSGQARYRQIGAFKTNAGSVIDSVYDKGETIPETVTSLTLITALNIDWALGPFFYRDISASSTFTFSNLVEGKTISVAIRNTSASEITVIFPTVIKSSAFVNTVKSSLKETVFTFMRINGKTYAASVGDMS